MKYGIFIDSTGKGNFKRVEKFPIFTEKNVAEAYLKRYVNIVNITEYVVRELT